MFFLYLLSPLQWFSKSALCHSLLHWKEIIHWLNYFWIKSPFYLWKRPITWCIIGLSGEWQKKKNCFSLLKCLLETFWIWKTDSFHILSNIIVSQSPGASCRFLQSKDTGTHRQSMHGTDTLPCYADKMCLLNQQRFTWRKHTSFWNKEEGE